MKRVHFLAHTYENAHVAAKSLGLKRAEVRYVRTYDDLDLIHSKERVILVNSRGRHTPAQDSLRNKFIEECTVKEIRLEAVTI